MILSLFLSLTLRYFLFWGLFVFLFRIIDSDFLFLINKKTKEKQVYEQNHHALSNNFLLVFMSVCVYVCVRSEKYSNVEALFYILSKNKQTVNIDLGCTCSSSQMISLFSVCFSLSVFVFRKLHLNDWM